ncbi:MAG: YciC family protein [Pontibacterium sp.]
MPQLPLEYIRQALYFFRSHFSMVVRIQLPFLLLINVLALLADTSFDSQSESFSTMVAGLTLLNVTLMPIYMAATIFYFGSVVKNQPLTAGQALLLGLTRWRALLLVYALSAFAVFSGLLFLVIPGIFILIRLGFADYICVAEQKGPLDALKESWERSEPWFWTLLNGLAILFVIVTGTEMLLELLLEKIGLLNAPVSALINMFFGLLNTALTVYGFRVYCIAQEETPG